MRIFKMKAVVSGASGYVGGAISSALEKEGWTVASPGASEGKKWRMPEEPVPGTFQGAAAFVHSAWDMRPANAAESHRTNVDGSLKLLQAARTAGVKTLLFVSSMSAFEGGESVYARTKLAVEKEFLAAGGIVVRPGLVYGEASGGMVGKLLKPVRKLPLIPVPCANVLQYPVHQDTVAGFAADAVAGKIPPGVYSLAHPEPLSLRRIVQILARSENKRPILLPIPWRPAWLGLEFCALMGIKLPFSADNLLGLARANPSPDFSSLKNVGIRPPAFPAGLGGHLS